MLKRILGIIRKRPACCAARIRKAGAHRKTEETDIRIELNIDGRGNSALKTGIPFLDHMLTLFSKHGLFDLNISAKGDLEVDIHHTNEDLGIVLGEVFNKALGDKKGIKRFATANVPMDEALANVVLDISGRPFLEIKDKRGITAALKDAEGYSLSYAEQFLRAFVNEARVTLNIAILSGQDTHHVLEAVFKALARALDEATQIDPRIKGVPSTKGKL